MQLATDDNLASGLSRSAIYAMRSLTILGLKELSDRKRLFPPE